MAQLEQVPPPETDPVVLFAAAEATIVAHNDWHNALHRKANYVADVRDFGAVGDGTTDDTQAFADAAAAGAAALIPPGDYLVDTVPATVALHGAGSNLTRLIHGRPDGPIVDFTNAPSTNFQTHVTHRGFSVIGQGTDATEVGLAMASTAGGWGLALIDDVAVRNTGGPALHATDLYCSTFRSCIFERPAGIDQGHDVAYAVLDGCNGTILDGCGFQSRTANPDSPAGCLTITGGHGVVTRDPWFEYIHPVTGGQVIHLDGGHDNRIVGHRDYDSSPAGPNVFYGRIAGTDGNVWESEIPGTYNGWDAGLQITGARHQIRGRKGYCASEGPNIRLEPNCGYVSIIAHGQQSSIPTHSGVVDDRSSNQTNTLLDLTNGHSILTTLDGD